MKKTLNPHAVTTVAFVVLIALALFAAGLLLSSCNSSKELFEAKSDKTKVEKSDSGAVTKTTNTDFKKDDWWKETIVYPPKDCTVNINYITPAVVYREGGSTTKVIDNTKFDSGWKLKYDSLQFVVAMKSKKTETQVLSFWHIVGIAVGASLFVGLLLFLLSKLKISLR